MMVSGLDTAACWPASPYFGMRVCDPGAHCLPACCPVSGVWSSHPEGQLLVSLVPRKVSVHGLLLWLYGMEKRDDGCALQVCECLFKI